jgi:hypothetical protein
VTEESEQVRELGITEVMMPSALPHGSLIYYMEQDTVNILTMLEMGVEQFGVTEEELTTHLMDKPQALQEGTDSLNMMAGSIQGRMDMLKSAFEAEKAKLERIKNTAKKFKLLTYNIVMAMGEQISPTSHKVIINGQAFTAKLTPGRVVQEEGFPLPPKFTRYKDVPNAVIREDKAYIPELDKKTAAVALKAGESLAEYGIVLERDAQVTVK